MKRREGGQALVEFALVAPIFLFILFAIIQMGLLFAGQNGLVSSVRETARYAVPYRVVDASGATDTCTFQVLGKLGSALAQSVIGYSGTYAATVTYVSIQDPTGEWYIYVRVHGEYKFPLYVPLVGNFLDGMDGVQDGKLKLSAQEEMRVENDAFATDPFLNAVPYPPSCQYP
jgi:Flp pilus assembly protein TadG